MPKMELCKADEQTTFSTIYVTVSNLYYCNLLFTSSVLFDNLHELQKPFLCKQVAQEGNDRSPEEQLAECMNVI